MRCMLLKHMLVRAPSHGGGLILNSLLQHGGGSLPLVMSLIGMYALLKAQAADQVPLYVPGPPALDYHILTITQGSWRDLHYVESHLASLMNKPMADSDLFTLVNSGGEPVVDALLYLIPHSGKFIQFRMPTAFANEFQALYERMSSTSNALSA